MRGSEPLDENVETVEVLFLLLQIEGHVGVVGRRELEEINVDEIGIVDQVGLQLQQLVKLGFRHVAMDAMGAKAATVLGLQVLDHKGRQSGNVGSLEATQEMSQPRLVQLHSIQIEQTSVSYSLQVAVLAKGSLQESVEADEVGIESGRMLGFLPFDDTAVVKA